MKRNLWLQQLLALVVKEFKEIKRDPSSYLVAGVLPMIFLFLFGYGITLDAGVLKVAVLDQSGGQNSIAIASAFANSPWFVSRSVRDMDEAGRMMSDSDIQGVIVIREDFDRQLAAGKNGDIQVIVDGTEPNNAQYIRNYSEMVISGWQSRQRPGGQAQSGAIDLQPRFWYNSTAKSEKFLVPGAITVIMTLIGTLLTSLVFAREWERGTMEALIATPVSRMQMLLGKLIPYFCMGMISMAICAIAAVTIFHVPFEGSVFAMVVISSIFMLCSLGQGLLISVYMHQQLVAAEAGLFSGFLPALMLSGFIFDIDSMVLPLQWLANLLPATYFNTCIRTLFLAGDDWRIFGPRILLMCLMGGLMLVLVYRKLQKRLDS